MLARELSCLTQWQACTEVNIQKYADNVPCPRENRLGTSGLLFALILLFVSEITRSGPVYKLVFLLNTDFH